MIGSSRIRTADSVRTTIRKLDQTTEGLEQYLIDRRIRNTLRQTSLTLAAIRGISSNPRRTHDNDNPNTKPRWSIDP
jgi:hypothetical protein